MQLLKEKLTLRTVANAIILYLCIVFFDITPHRSLVFRTYYVSSIRVFSVYLSDFAVQVICTLMPGQKSGLT